MLLRKLARKVDCQKYRDHEVNQSAGYRLCFIVGCKERFAKVNRCLKIEKRTAISDARSGAVTQNLRSHSIEMKGFAAMPYRDRPTTGHI